MLANSNHMRQIIHDFVKAVVSNCMPVNYMIKRGVN